MSKLVLENDFPREMRALRRGVKSLQDTSPVTDGIAVPQVRIRHNAAQSIAHNLFVTLGTTGGATTVFNSVDYDLGTDIKQHSTLTPGRLTCQRDGLYRIFGQVYWNVGAASTSRYARINLVKNIGGTFFIADHEGHAANAVNSFTCLPQTDYRLQKGDYIEMIVYQSSGAILSILADRLTLGWHFVSP